MRSDGHDCKNTSPMRICYAYKFEINKKKLLFPPVMCHTYTILKAHDTRPKKFE